MQNILLPYNPYFSFLNIIQKPTQILLLAIFPFSNFLLASPQSFQDLVITFNLILKINHSLILDLDIALNLELVRNILLIAQLGGYILFIDGIFLKVHFIRICLLLFCINRNLEFFKLLGKAH